MTMDIDSEEDEVLVIGVYLHVVDFNTNTS